MGALKVIINPIIKIYERFGKDISDIEFVNKPPISIWTFRP